MNGGRVTRVIHDISNTQFRSKFDNDLARFRGGCGIGVISDYEDQPLIIGSHLGTYAIVTVGAVRNAGELAAKAFGSRRIHFSEMSGDEINPTELVASLIDEEPSFVEGIVHAQEAVEGSCSMLLLTDAGLYAARDLYGRTPVVIGRKEGSYCAALESCSFPNLGYEVERELGPGEIVLISKEGIEVKRPPRKTMQVCSFLWIYYGFPTSTYEGINVEDARYRCGAALAARDDVELDFASGIPDSGIAHALGYAAAAGIPYKRPFVKYTPTWSRSFMPQNQSVRDQVARMKLIPIKEIIAGKSILFCDDSIVRGTQLRGTFRRVFDYGARAIHLRPACPPLLFACKFLNFSRSASEMDLAARRAISEIEGGKEPDLDQYCDESSSRYSAMVERIGSKMGISSLRFQRLDDMVKAIGLPCDKLCTYCWNGRDLAKS